MSGQRALHALVGTMQNSLRDGVSWGLDPNKWFGNIELLVSQKVGQTTVQYVSNIYKYYIDYKLVVEQGQSLQ